MSHQGRSKICRHLWRTPKLWQSRPFVTNGRKSKQFGTSWLKDLRNWSSRHLLSIQQGFTRCGAVRGGRTTGPRNQIWLFRSDFGLRSNPLAKEPLAKSGLTFPPFYVEDKQSNDKSPMQNKFDFRILWIPRDMPPSDAISKIQQHHGLIRGRTGRGIRLQNDEFKKAFPLFYPGRTTPEEITANFHWLLLGGPGSADLEAIGTFLKDAGIKGKPLRKQGQNWKICTEEKLTEVQYSINGKNVLFQLLPSFTSAPNPIRASGSGKGQGKGKSCNKRIHGPSLCRMPTLPRTRICNSNRSRLLRFRRRSVNSRPLCVSSRKKQMCRIARQLRSRKV